MAPVRTTGRGAPPLDESPQMSEYLASRRPDASHRALGLDPDLDIRFVTPSGEVREHSRVVKEVRDDHTGNIDAFVESKGSGKKEIHRLRFAPDTSTTMRQIENKRVKRVEGE